MTDTDSDGESVFITQNTFKKLDSSLDMLDNDTDDAFDAVEFINKMDGNTFNKLNRSLDNATDDAFDAVEFMNKMDGNTLKKFDCNEQHTNLGVKLINKIDEEIMNTLDDNNNKPVAERFGRPVTDEEVNEQSKKK